MNLHEFTQSLTHSSVPADLSGPLVALWHDGRGDWATAHAVAQELTDAAGAWIHAYLHRKEGDTSNAGYWYRRAGQRPATGNLADEWTSIVSALLDGH